jgi:hypothetical protein
MDAQNDVWDAFDTGLMSDAKTAVFSLRAEAQADKILPVSTKSELVRILSEAWTAISGAGGDTTEERSRSSHAKLAEAERYLIGLTSPQP